MTFTQLVTYSETLICLCTFEHQCQNDSGTCSRKSWESSGNPAALPRHMAACCLLSITWNSSEPEVVQVELPVLLHSSLGVKCNPDNGFKISYFVKFSIFLEPPRFLHWFFALLMRHGTQTDFLLNAGAFFTLLRLNKLE